MTNSTRMSFRSLLTELQQFRKPSGVFTCPCCGGKPIQFFIGDYEWIECRECRLGTEVVQSGESTRIWNSRV